MKFTSILLSVFLFGLLLLPVWYESRANNLNLGQIITKAYQDSWNTIWHYKTESSQNVFLMFWIASISILTIASFLHGCGMNIGLALLIGLIVTIILMFGLSMIQPVQINIVGNYTK